MFPTLRIETKIPACPPPQAALSLLLGPLDLLLGPHHFKPIHSAPSVQAAWKISSLE